jgi:hypothetical protein
MNKSTTREPGYTGTFEKNLSITRAVKGRVFWTHYYDASNYVTQQPG